MNIEALSSIAIQLMTSDKVELARRTHHDPPHRPAATQICFVQDRRPRVYSIEQNREKSSRWGQLAKKGHAVVRFKDVKRNRFIAAP